jgi:hypothetical protein
LEETVAAPVKKTERTGLSFVAVIVSSISHLYAFYIVRQLSICTYYLKCYCIVHCMQGLCRYRLGTADRALTHVTTVVRLTAAKFSYVSCVGFREYLHDFI